ncbi:class I SAM-dependent methyltransferase [Marinagarivorans algicola]|uniref:class I SAM-dependent methyltransferase n=1 Tax=Marinagarivorans algicola TaxID=1513270 RepID=UPI0009EBEED8|nr:class I SAM-dependent methyltransferase [Marinagarivorans algicola]
METINIGALTLPQNAKVLDLGCGEGRHCHALAWHHPHCQVVGVDLNLRDLRIAQTRGQAFFSAQNLTADISYPCADGTQLPFSDASFDAVICSEVLEHIPDYQAFLAEINRIIKPKGLFLASVPRAWPERICWALSAPYHEVEGGHVRIFNGKNLANTIQQLGFTQTQRYYAHALHSPYWWLRCLFWRWGEDAWPCRMYHKLLVWDLIKKPKFTRVLEQCLNPIMGKSVVWHFIKSSPTPRSPTPQSTTTSSTIASPANTLPNASKYEKNTKDAHLA